MTKDGTHRVTSVPWGDVNCFSIPSGSLCGPSISAHISPSTEAFMQGSIFCNSGFIGFGQRDHFGSIKKLRQRRPASPNPSIKDECFGEKIEFFNLFNLPRMHVILDAKF